MPHKDPEEARAYERERCRKRTADRRARGLCPRCGKHRPAPGRKVCETCGERARDSERLRYTRAKAGGAHYGGRNSESRRRMGAGAEQKAQARTQGGRPVHGLRPMPSPGGRRRL